MKKQNNSVGFWLGYIDSFTVISSLFIILFFVYYSTYVIRNEQEREFIDARKKMVERLKDEPQITIHESLNEGGWQVTINDDILFQQNSAQVQADGQELIHRISGILSETVFNTPEMKKGNRLIIGGHADTTGHPTWDRNEKARRNLLLSHGRAVNVAFFLQKKLPGIRMEAIGYGAQKPKPYAKKNRENRRITIVVQPIAAEYLIAKSGEEPVKRFEYMSDSHFR